MKIILSQFSFGPVMVKVGLGFIGSVLLGYLFGPLWEPLAAELVI